MLAMLATKRVIRFSVSEFVLAALAVIVPLSASAQSYINWNTAIHYANLVNIAENVSPNNDYAASDKDQISVLGYTYLATIWGNDFTAIFDPTIADTVSYGFLAVSPSGELVTVIRGTTISFAAVRE
jgi:apolipoprotein N-acyltransferase